jgi:hypothetical protein
VLVLLLAARKSYMLLMALTLPEVKIRLSMQRAFDLWV